MKKQLLKKQRIIIIILFIIFILFFFILKLLLVITFNKQNVALTEILVPYKEKTSYSVKTKNLPKESYLEYEGIKFINLLDNSYQKEKINNSIAKTVKFTNKKEKSALYISFTKSFVEAYPESITFYGDTNIEDFFANLTTKEKRKYLEKNYIKNDLDLYNHLEKIEKKKANIFTSLTEMKNILTLKQFSLTALPIADNFKVLKGDIKGYVIETEKYTEITIIEDKKTYKITTIGPNFSKDKIEQILETITLKS